MSSIHSETEETTDEPHGVVCNPDVKLEDVRESDFGNVCSGRGGATAAGRGYNTEKLANAVLDIDQFFIPFSDESWYDVFISTRSTSDPSYCQTESKSCIYRYPSGGYGRFRIWKQNHDKLYAKSNEEYPDNVNYLYFFLVYKVKDGVEKEVGKLFVPVQKVHDAIDSWSERNHSSMGQQRARDISWRVLLSRLGLSVEEFEQADAIDLTTE